MPSIAPWTPSLPLTTLIFAVSLTAVACGKKDDTATKAPSQAAAPAPAPSPAPTAAPAPAATAAPAAAGDDPEVTRKRAELDRAMADDAIKRDPKGQWAVLATASSSYAGETKDIGAGYHPMRATGAPDVPMYADEGRAWTAKEADAGIEWLELSYLKAVNATAVRVRQSYGPGAIAKVELFDDAGKAFTVWQGPDNTKYPPSTIAWLETKFDKTTYKTQKVRITLATNLVPGYNEIDAVQLLGE
jgi:hypothetical protein